ncbi:MAG: hypothetical protein SFV54_04745 [Bryobacteraceae bacterium]|nr:hypothetical protein [Bryobacteraceae bacterium]
MFAALHNPGNAEAEPALLALAQELTPLFEHTLPNTVVLDMEGFERLLGPPATMAAALDARARERALMLHIAVAANPDAAVQASLRFPGVTVVPAGEEARWLGPLEIERLPLTPEMLETLDRWGIRTFAEFAALPVLGIATRFGQDGVYLQKLARGEQPRPLVPWRPEFVFARRDELEHAIELLEPLLFVLGRQLSEICAELNSHGLATHEIHVTLGLDGGAEDKRTLRLPVPVAASAPLLKLVQLELEAHRPPAAILAIALEAIPVAPRRLQTGLFVPQAPEPAKLELTLRRIAKLVGEENVGTPSIPDTHRPGAFRMERAQRFETSAASPPQRLALALRVFRPPLRADVQSAEGMPVAVRAPGVRGKVVRRAGPWRTSGDWWRSDAWHRDEWDLGLSDGALYRVYWDERERAWFVEGRYD